MGRMGKKDLAVIWREIERAEKNKDDARELYEEEGSEIARSALRRWALYELALREGYKALSDVKKR